MGIFSYKNFNSDESKILTADALALIVYSYRNFDDGLAHGYWRTGFNEKLPLTMLSVLVGNSQSQGILPRLPWNPDAEKAAQNIINQAGWYTISAKKLDYAGKTDPHGTFFGETFDYSTAQVEVMGRYDDNGRLMKIGIAFRGTSGQRDALVSDTIGDVIHDLLMGISPEFADSYAYKAFGKLLQNVADFAKLNGLTGKDIIVSGHSLGGMAVNSMAGLSDTAWGGFFSASQYVAIASPTQYEEGKKVLNIGYENDPVFRVLYGNKFTSATLGIHDSPHDSTTDNIINFNDYYSSKLWNLTPFSLLNISSWISHMPFFYDDGLTRILDSEFYSLTNRDSTVIIANLSDDTRGTTWVQDLNRSALPHSGPTFIIGSDYDDLIQGSKGNSYLEGRKGNNIFRISGGYNIISGGKGKNTLDLQRPLDKTEITYDGTTLYIRTGLQDLTIAHDIQVIRSKKSSLLFNNEIDYKVTGHGLQSKYEIKSYANSIKGNNGNDTVHARKNGDWLFASDNSSILIGDKGNHTFIGGAGDDTIYASRGLNTFLFVGHFGQDVIYGFNIKDQLIFIGIENGTGHDYHDFVSQTDNNIVFDFGHSSVTLIDTGMDILAQAKIILA